MAKVQSREEATSLVATTAAVANRTQLRGSLSPVLSDGGGLPPPLEETGTTIYHLNTGVIQHSHPDSAPTRAADPALIDATPTRHLRSVSPRVSTSTATSRVPASPSPPLVAAAAPASSPTPPALETTAAAAGAAASASVAGAYFDKHALPVSVCDGRREKEGEKGVSP